MAVILSLCITASCQRSLRSMASSCPSAGDVFHDGIARRSESWGFQAMSGPSVNHGVRFPVYLVVHSSGCGSKNKRNSKMACPGKWKHGPKPAVCPSCLICFSWWFTRNSRAIRFLKKDTYGQAEPGRKSQAGVSFLAGNFRVQGWISKGICFFFDVSRGGKVGQNMRGI